MGMGGLLFTSTSSVEAVKAFREKLAPGKVLRLEEAELTTGQAAELLGVSRPYLVRLLEEGKIPHHKVGTHRRVRARDLLAYLEASRKRGRELLDELIGEAQELGLGY